jgi:hypothetical protein
MKSFSDSTAGNILQPQLPFSISRVEWMPTYLREALEIFKNRKTSLCGSRREERAKRLETPTRIDGLIPDPTAPVRQILVANRYAIREGIK